jgi:hypothetical protein
MSHYTEVQIRERPGPDDADADERRRRPTAKKKAIIVVARTILVIIWHVLAGGAPYHELGTGFFTRRLIAKFEAQSPRPPGQPSARRLTTRPRRLRLRYRSTGCCACPAENHSRIS